MLENCLPLRGLTLGSGLNRLVKPCRYGYQPPTLATVIMQRYAYISCYQFIFCATSGCEVSYVLARPSNVQTAVFAVCLQLDTKFTLEYAK